MPKPSEHTDRSGRAALPSIDRLLQSPGGMALSEQHGHTLTRNTFRQVLAEARHQFALGRAPQVQDVDVLLAACATKISQQTRASMDRVFNLSGTVLHTNLGRALLPESAVAAATAAMQSAVNLEYDLTDGQRGERDAHVEHLITQLTGAEGAVVVNNNAAAVYLILYALARRKEVIVSRGELVEIGGSFRIPDIMASANCKLREVGTTNRTHLKDYEQSITTSTAAIMKVHASNYRIEGFSHCPAESALAELAHRHDLPLLNDLGSGTLIDLDQFGLPHEPTPREALLAGADIVTFSGDKLLGGPQCGLIVGRKDLIKKIRHSPMKRALRLDKIRLAALASVLQLYTTPEKLREHLPTLRLLTRATQDIQATAQRLLPSIQKAMGNKIQAAIIDCASQIGSGALPVDILPSAGIALTPHASKRGQGLNQLALAWRQLPRPVIGRIHAGALVFDLRCLEPAHEQAFVAQLAQFKHAHSVA